MASAQNLRPDARVIDVALPYTFSDGRHHQILQGEAMAMPKEWRRGFWGPLYHMVSGYGWNTVLACLVEALAQVSSGESRAYAQGATLRAQDVQSFGREITRLGFVPQVIPHRTSRQGE